MTGKTRYIDDLIAGWYYSDRQKNDNIHRSGLTSRCTWRPSLIGRPPSLILCWGHYTPRLAKVVQKSLTDEDAVAGLWFS
jgi:hypothetical protein